MKYKNSIITLSLFSILTALSTTSATSENQVVTARYVNLVQDKQAKSIIDGIKLGKLTPREATKLREEQKDINTLERGMRKNGALNAKELQVLFARLEKSRNHINQLLRNNISTHRELEPSNTQSGSLNESRI